MWCDGLRGTLLCDLRRVRLLERLDEFNEDLCGDLDLEMCVFHLGLLEYRFCDCDLERDLKCAMC